jgi:sulfur-carrier protein
MTGAATVTVRLPGVLRPSCSGLKEFPLSVSSVRHALDAIERLHPSLHRSICDETGAVRRHVNVFVNTDHVRDHAGLDTALAPGDVLWFLPAVSGG